MLCCRMMPCGRDANGPRGGGCQNGGAPWDEVPFDGTFACNCTAAYGGDNCQERLEPKQNATAGGHGGGTGVRTDDGDAKVLAFVLGTVLVLCLLAAAAACHAKYASRAVQFHPHGGQPDFVWLPARTPHVGPQYVWCLTARRNQEKYPPDKYYRSFPRPGTKPTSSATTRVIFRSSLPSRYAPRAVQFHPHGGQSVSGWPLARTPHVGPQYVW